MGMWEFSNSNFLLTKKSIQWRFSLLAKALFNYDCDLWLGKVIDITCENCAIRSACGYCPSAQTPYHIARGLCLCPLHRSITDMCVQQHVCAVSYYFHLNCISLVYKCLLWLCQTCYQSQNNIHSSELFADESLVWQDQLMTNPCWYFILYWLQNDWQTICSVIFLDI